MFGCGVSSGIEVPPAYLQQILELHPTAAVAMADCSHAFNRVDRAAIFDELGKTAKPMTEVLMIFEEGISKKYMLLMLF